MASASFDLGLRIVGDSKEATKALADLDRELKGLGTSSQSVEKDLDGVELKTEQLASTVDEAKTSTRSFSQELTALGGSLTKIGSSLTLLTAPLTVLAGLSLKNVFELGKLEGANTAFAEFSKSVGILVDNFKSLSVEIGTRLIPVVRPLINVATNIISEFRRMDDETKELIGTIALVAGVLGPTLIALGSLSGLIGAAIPVVTALGSALIAIGSAIMSPITLLVALGLTVAGTVNVFYKLQEAGVDTADALHQAFNLFVTGFNSFIVANFLKGISVMLGAVAEFAGVFSTELETKLNNATLAIGEFASGLDASFESQKTAIDGTLAKVGSSAADAFTFGLSSKLEGIGAKISEMLRSQNTEGLDLGLAKGLEKEAKLVEKPLTEIQLKAKEVQNSITSNMTDAFMSISDGADSAEEAFKKMAMAILSDLKRMAIQAAITKALFPGGGLAGAAAGFASGGYVSGRGSGTSDSIPARLSDGEFVIRASSVKSVGVGFLNAVNSMGARSFKKGIPGGFADGGEVSAPSNSDPQSVTININNTGSEKEASEASFDPESMIVSVVMSDLNRNGSISRSIGSTFGLGRGDFR